MGCSGELVDCYRPDLVHLHHFVYWGIELFDFFALRGIPVVFTAHEYMAICHHYGQMVKTNGQLCFASSPAECTRCFPEISSGFFFLRREMILEKLMLASIVVSPSAFLRDRLDDWSSGRLAVTVIENPRAVSAYEPPAEVAAAAERSERHHRIIGYFGQLNHFKGTDVLLDAFRQLKERGINVRLRLFGANLEMQDEAFRERTRAKIADLGEWVEFFGSYRNEAVVRLMADCDAVVIPSIWWENSPVVVQEAIQAGVTIIASRIGGLAEKLRSYQRAVLFEVGSASDLADRIANLRAEPAVAGLAASDKMADEPWKALIELYWQCLEAASPEVRQDVAFLPDTKRARKIRRRVG